jgi:hypothetical protein
MNRSLQTFASPKSKKHPKTTPNPKPPTNRPTLLFVQKFVTKSKQSDKPPLPTIYTLFQPVKSTQQPKPTSTESITTQNLS